METTRPQCPAPKKTHWTLYVDGSSTQNGCGAGIICQSPEGDVYEYAMRFQFQASNNEAEYEALLAGIRMCKAAGATRLEAVSDSQLVVSQVNGQYEARETAMIKYLQTLEEFSLSHVPRAENNQADALSKLASSATNDTPRSVFWGVKDKRSIEAEEEVNYIDRRMRF